MSSRTNTGKKKLQRTFTAVNQNLTRHQVIQVRLNQLQPQIIEIKREKEKEKGSSIWTILGESSLMLAIATAILFVIGWAYESNWYAYFGISTEKITIPAQQVLIRSIPIVFFAFILVVISYVILSLIYLVLLSSFKGNLSVQKLIEVKWWFVFGLGLVITLMFSFAIFPFRISGNYLDLISQLPFEGLSVIPIGIIIIAAIITFPPLLLYSRTRSLLIRFMFWIVLKSFSTKINQMMLATVFGFFYLFAILFMSSSLALYDASARRKGVTDIGNLQEVYLVSPKSLSYLSQLQKFCYLNASCIYGPFNLLEENDNSFILAEGNRQTSHFQKPELFIFSRSDQDGAYSIVPASIPIPSLTSTPAPVKTFVPSQTLTITLVHQLTFTVTPTFQQVVPTPTP